MSDTSKEPEKYSLEEMVSRLKSKANDEGELVTREDGSQVIKMRKRKRRSNQPAKKDAKKNHRVQIIQIAAITAAVFLIFVLGIVGLVYANSSAYRKELIRKAEQTSGAKVEMRQFRMNPATANSSHVSMNWPEGNVLQMVELYSPVAKISPSSFFGSRFLGDEIVAVKGNLVLRAPLVGESVRYGESNRSKKRQKLIQFGRYAVSALNVYFGSDRLSKKMLESTEASFSPTGNSGKGEIRLVGGLMRYGEWPEMELDRSYIRMNGPEMDVQSLRFRIPTEANERGVDRGWIDMTGILKLLDSGEAHRLDVKVDEFRVSYLLGVDLGRFFAGKVMTDEDAIESNFLKFHPDLADEAEMELGLMNAMDSEIDLKQFDFLTRMAKIFNDPWFEMPNFASDILIAVKRSGELVEVQDFRMEQRGRMAIRGNLSAAEGGMISGRIRVGLPGNLISESKDRRMDRIFGEVSEGYRWLDVEISGTGATPDDNFREIYEAANEDKQAEDAVEGGPVEKVEGDVDDFDGLIGEE